MPLKNKLLMVLFLILSVLFFRDEVYVIDSARKYYDEYMEMFNAYCPADKISGIHNQYIIYGKVRSDDVLGICMPMMNNVVILINKIPFEHKFDNEQRLIIYHELNHCLLGMEHNDDSNSIMFPYLPLLPNISIIKQQIDIFKKECNNK